MIYQFLFSSETAGSSTAASGAALGAAATGTSSGASGTAAVSGCSSEASCVGVISSSAIFFFHLPGECVKELLDNAVDHLIHHREVGGKGKHGNDNNHRG